VRAVSCYQGQPISGLNDSHLPADFCGDDRRQSRIDRRLLGVSLAELAKILATTSLAEDLKLNVH